MRAACTGIKKIFDFASIYHVRSACHGPMDMSPATMGANIHVDTCDLATSASRSSPATPRTRDDVFKRDWRYERGYLYPNETPGTGTDIDEELAAKYPYSAAYLPVARLEDGSMTSW